MTKSSTTHSYLCVISTCVVVLMCNFRSVQGHGHLVDPPSRSSMWQDGFKTPPNYNQNQLNCGGFYNHWILNSGKCGICGDAYQSASPRDNESGGRYGKGIITRTYSQGQKFTVRVLVTANHQGWFEFKLCPNGSPTTPVTQACLDRYVLALADGSGTKYQLGPQERSVSVEVMLPPGVTCKQCVLQWRWRAGNNYGRDDDGTTCKGCGPQEEFYGCSDIAITSGSNPGGQPQVPVTAAPITVTTPRPTIGTPRPQTTRAPIITFPPVTLPHLTNVVPTYYPTMRPINFPLFTTARPTARPVTTPKPITIPNPVVTSPTPIINNGVTLPTGFVPISINPTANPLPTLSPVQTNPPVTFAPVQTNPPITFAPARTNPPFTFKPMRTNPPYVTQTPRPTFYRPPSTTSRLQLMTTLKPNPTPNPNVTLRPFTLFPPFINNKQTTQTTSSFFRPRTTPRPVFTFQPIVTTPFYRPPTTHRPVIITNPQTPAPTTFYRPPTTHAPATTAQPLPVTSQLGRCYAINSWKGVGELENYCHVQCNMVGGVCPPAFCQCQP